MPNVAWEGADRSRSALGGRHHHIRLQEGFAYLAIVLDAFSRRVVGWALDTHLQASLAIDALNRAIAARRTR
jgi:transposase InsO family protein